jgi:type I restriction enzyme R subunit
LTTFNESTLELAALEWLAGLGYETVSGPDIAPDGLHPARTSYDEVILASHLKAALARINPNASADALAEAFRQVVQLSNPNLIHANRDFHRMLVEGVAVETQVNGEPRGETVRLVDLANPAANLLLAVNQFTITAPGSENRRPDILLFVNGIPLAIIELKNPGDEDATMQGAWNQLQTYHLRIPALFRYVQIEAISDGLFAALGTLGTGFDRFAAWKTADGRTESGPGDNPLKTLIQGALRPDVLLDLVPNYIVFEDFGTNVVKKVAAYHQFYAVRKAIEQTLVASRPNGDRRGGVLWHTQGSGKSLTMLWFAGRISQHPAMTNPTIVMITDRLDLDDQLLGTFQRGRHVLRQTPEHAETRSHLRALIAGRAGGGVIFTTMQKFTMTDKFDAFPELSDRRNIIVMADEAHRGQYNFLDGTAKNLREALPNATYIGFTGTPLELSDRVTTQVFGDYIDIYDMKRAVDDGATVPIHYEAQLVKLDLPEEQRKLLDAGFEEITEREETEGKERLKTRWAQLEVIVGTPTRIRTIAEHLVAHFERRRELRDGKGMVVCMSRRIAVDLYDEIIKLRPDWHDPDDTRGFLKVVMTGAASDPPEWQPHIRNSGARDALAQRFKDPDDSFKLAIVRDMWLTGFDVPTLDTMYVDKPMQGHALMQAIARVNRVFRDKPGGLVVDYIGLTNNLKEALRTYVRSGGEGTPVAHARGDQIVKDESLNVFLGKLELCRETFTGHDYSAFIDPLSSPAERTEAINPATNFIFMKEGRRPGVIDKFNADVTAMVRAFRLCGADHHARKHRLEVAFFGVIKGAIAKIRGGDDGAARGGDDLDWVLRKLVDQAILPEGVTDVFAMAGLDRPDISVISEGFLAEVAAMPQKNLAAEMLRKLLEDQIARGSRGNLVQSRAFSDRLQDSMTRYHNRAIQTVEVIEELLALARQMQAAKAVGQQLGLSEAEYAFYSALAENESAREVLGNQQLLLIAREVAETVRQNTGIDWAIREQARARLRAMVKRLLRKYGYPPDLQESAVTTVIEQAEHISQELTTA